MTRESARFGARGRFAAAALAAVLTVSVVSAITASARSVGAHTTHTQRSSSELFDGRAAGGQVSSSRVVLKARAALARSLGSQGVVIADPWTDTLRMVGRLDGFLTGASEVTSNRRHRSGGTGRGRPGGLEAIRAENGLRDVRSGAALRGTGGVLVLFVR